MSLVCSKSSLLPYCKQDEICGPWIDTVFPSSVSLIPILKTKQKKNYMMFTFIYLNPRNIRVLAIILNLERVSRICFCEICFIEPKDRLKQVETILNIVNITVLCLVTELCLSLCDPTDCSLPGSSVYGDSPGKNIGMGCHFLLQGIFPTQGSNPGLLHWRWILYHLSHQLQRL